MQATQCDIFICDIAQELQWQKVSFVIFFILLLSWCDAGILVNKDGIPEEEENFDEAIRAVNMALVPTRVRSLKKNIYMKLCSVFCQLI